MPDRVMNVGFVGCGGFVQGNHLPNAAGNPNFCIRALCDLRRDILDTLRDRYRPDYVTTDLRDLARDRELELVVLGTHPTVRVEPIRVLAGAGKHLLVEKPMSLGREDSREIVQIVRQAGVKFQVGFNRPYSRIMQEAKRLFRKARRGRTLILYRIVGENVLWPKFHRDDVASGRSNTIVHEVTHIFDLLNWLTDQDPQRVYATGGPSDDHSIVLNYPDETVATIVSGSCGTEGYTKERMEIFTDNKTIVMDDFVDLECAQIPGEENRRFPLKSDPIRGRTEGVSAAELRRELKSWRAALTPEQIKVGYYYDNRPCVDKGHAASLQFLYEAIRRDQPTQTNEYRGALATLIALEAIRSLESGQAVDLDFDFLK